MCYRTGKYTVCRHVRVFFSPEILQAGAVKRLKGITPNMSSVSCFVLINSVILNAFGSCSISSISVCVIIRYFPRSILLES